MKLLSLLLCFALPLAGADLPAEARALQEARDKELHKVNLAYLQKLDGLKVKYAAAGDTKNVAAVLDLIAEAEGKKAGESSNKDALASLVGVWRRDTDGSIWRFAADGKATYNAKIKLIATYNPEARRFVVVSDRSVDYLTAGKNPDVLNGVSERAGRDYKFKLERVK